jgi:hypothetical protein
MAFQCLQEKRGTGEKPKEMKAGLIGSSTMPSAGQSGPGDADGRQCRKSQEHAS